MATYIIDGKRYVFSGDINPQEAVALAAQLEKQQATPQVEEGATYDYPAETVAGADPDQLQYNKDWLHASKEVWGLNNTTPFGGNAKELAEYGLDQMGWLANTPVLAVDAVKLRGATQQQQKSFAYLMDQYDNNGWSWSGAGRWVRSVATDPVNYTGLLSFGVGTAASQAAKVMSRAGLKSMLRAGLWAGTEGAISNAADDVIRQDIRIEGERQEEYSGAQTAEAAAIGFGAGAVLGGGVDAAAIALRKAAPEAPSPPAATVVPAPPANAVPAAPRPQEQLSLDLRDTSTADGAAQARIGHLDETGRTTVNEGEQGALFPDLPNERRLDQIPDFVRGKPAETMSDMTDRLSGKWGVDHQQKIDFERWSRSQHDTTHEG